MNVDPFSLPLADPLGTAAGTIDAREGFLVTVDAGDERGLGEATPLPGWTESHADCERALARAREHAPDWAAALDALAGAPAARHGLELATADARARAAGEPLYRHLGGDERVGTVPVNATVGDGSVERTAAAAAAAVEAGYPAVKVKVGARRLDEDLSRLRAVREQVGVELRADANGAWSPDRAERALRAIADLDVAYVEQPLPAGDLDGHARLREGTDVGVAVDESVAERGLDAVVEAGAADAVVLKPMVLGGPVRARRAALRARESGLGAVVTTTVDGAVARTAAVHVAASLPDRPACGLATADRLAADLRAEDPAPVVGGAARVPQEPGNAGRNASAGPGSH